MQHDAFNKIVPFNRVISSTKKGKKCIPDCKLDLLEHVMLFQFDGPDEFYHAIDLLIERWSADA